MQSDSVQLWCTVCETSGIFVYFIIFSPPHCETALRYQNAEAAGTASQVEVEVKPLQRWSRFICSLTRAPGKTCSTSLQVRLTDCRSTNLLSVLKKTHTHTQCSRTGGSWQADVAQHNCVFVYNGYIHVYNLSVVKVHVYSFVNMYICVYIGLHEVI